MKDKLEIVRNKKIELEMEELNSNMVGVKSPDSANRIKSNLSVFERLAQDQNSRNNRAYVYQSSDGSFDNLNIKIKTK